MSGSVCSWMVHPSVAPVPLSLLEFPLCYFYGDPKGLRASGLAEGCPVSPITSLRAFLWLGIVFPSQAAVFFSNETLQLPSWVGVVFD